MIVCTLAHPGGLGSSVIADARARLANVGARTGPDDWIEPNRAVRLACEAIERAAACDALRPLAEVADVFVGGPAHARLFVADMDSTMVACECLDELAAYAGLKREVAAITERAMRGELDFAASLTERVALLADLPAAAIDECRAARVAPSPGARTLIATLGAHGVRTVLVSGGFTAFAEPVGADLGFDRVVANRLEIMDSRLTGRVLSPIIGADSKRAVLKAEAAPLGGPLQAIAIGDGANDIPMIDAAGLGIAYRGKPAVEAAADGCVRHGDLTSVLWALGIARGQWVQR